MKLGGVFLAAIVCVFGSINALAQQEQKPIATFRWLDDKKDSEVLALIQNEFRVELAPGKQNKPRKLRRVGVFGNSAIVLIDSDETEVVEGDRRYDYFSTAYNFDLSSGKKLPIATADTFWKWNLFTRTRFERGPAPDIVFTYFDCVDCEATHILGSFRFDAESKEWSIRKWGKNEKGTNNEGVFIGSNAQYGDFLFRYPTLFKVQDFDADQFDDVLVWSREKAYEWEKPQKLHSVNDTIVVYSFKNGQFSQLKPIGKELTKLQALLCVGKDRHELCRVTKRPAVTH